MSEDDASAFAARFLDDVAVVAADADRARVAAVGRLLSDALACGGAAWCALYRSVTVVVDASRASRAGAAYVRLRAFLDENVDLAEPDVAKA